MTAEHHSPGWQVVAASVPGSSHIDRGLRCQDAHLFRVLSDGTVVAAIADGAGSATRADEASICVVRSSVEFLSDRIAHKKPVQPVEYEALLADSVDYARSALLGLVSQSSLLAPNDVTEHQPECELHDVATTLLVAVITNSFLSLAQIGDGAIVCRNLPDCLSVITEPAHGEYINETTFITSPSYRDHLLVKVLPSEDLDAIALLTDGLQFLALSYSDYSAHAPFFTPLFKFAANPEATQRDLEAFLRSDRVCEKTDDDKTLVLAVRL